MMFSAVTPAASPSGPTAKPSLTNFLPAGKSGADSVLSGREYGSEMSLTLRPLPGESIPELVLRMAGALQGVTILNLLVFGSIKATAAATDAMQKTFGGIDWPVTWVEGRAFDGGPIAGIQVFGLRGDAVQRIRLGGTVVGSVFEEGGARHCLLGGLGPTRRFSSPADQTKETLETLETALMQVGFSIADTVRTWFFLNDILSWYGKFNAARTQIYSGVKFRTRSLPASTGIGGRNPAGTALTLSARAMQPLSSATWVEETASPLQCPAPAYGSSFSRAMEIATSGGRHLLISGTASIAPGGETLWQNDSARQVELTMNVVAALLHARGFTFEDLTRAVAYCKRPADARAFAAWCAAHHLLSLPIVRAHCDICRDDLLFELEADARKSG
jgi:enamine deaminase RidA (YjgF/YER057c/UK114 family)